MSFSFSPALGLAEAVSLACLAAALALWFAYRASSGIPRLRRGLLLTLRGSGLALLAFCWLNPGNWREETLGQSRRWLVLLDRSSSMAEEELAGETRWKAATKVVESLHKAHFRGEILARPFSGVLEDEAEDVSTLSPTGKGTALAEALSTSLAEYGSSLAGIVVLSDGRMTSRASLSLVAQRARGRGVPILTTPLGTEQEPRDLAIQASPRQVMAFAGQPLKLGARLENKGLGPIRPEVVLRSPDGKEAGRQALSLSAGASENIAFSFSGDAAQSGEYRIEAAPQPGEQLRTNNRDTVRVQLLPSRLRVLLLEGAPYWDSKFLAQLLRRQDAIEVIAVHRLNEERYFRVEENGAEPLADLKTILPEDAAGLSRYDLIVFGKGADGFLTAARLAALQSFIRDHGGAVLFARGKPYNGQFAGLSPMEPVEWGEGSGGGLQFRPVADAAAGLFGGALPAPEDRAWATLPLLEDVRSIARLRPFARVLAEGVVPERETRFPLLITRRYGRGTVATLNADGLWRWDFRPEVREAGSVYQQFWVQLMAWCATWSEFRAGEDFAVRLRDDHVAPGNTVRAVIAYRGLGTPQPRPRLVVRMSGAFEAQVIQATELPGEDGGREWAAVFTPAEPGDYAFHVVDEAHPEREQGSALLNVLGPIPEADDTRAEPATLEQLARESGGQSFAPSAQDALIKTLHSLEKEQSRGKPHWEPLWTNWWMALALGLTFGGEWWLRRREGLL